MSHLERGGLVAVIIGCVLWMAWPLPVELGTAWTSARAEGDLAWSLLLHNWMTDIWMGRASWSSDPRVWSPDGGSLPQSAWNLVALGTTAWLGIGTTALNAWHRSMLLVGLLNGLGGAWLGYRVGGRRGAVVGAVACVCAPLPWFELAEGRLEQGLVAPVAVWFAEAWALQRDPRPVLAGAALGLVAATYWFFGPLAAVVALPLALTGPKREASGGPLSRWGLGTSALGGAVLVGTVVVALWPILGALHAGAGAAAVSDPMLSTVQRLASSVSPLALVVGGPLPAHRLPIVVLLAAPLAYSHAALRPWLWAMLAAAVLAAGTVASVDGMPLQLAGLELSLPLRLLDFLPGFRRFWWPDRIVALAMVAGAGLLAAAVYTLPPRWATPVLTLVCVGVAVDGRAQLRAAVATGDPRIPASSHDPQPHGGFFAPPHTPLLSGAGPVLVGPWPTTGNLLPLVGLTADRPLLRGDGAADRRLWPAAFSARVDASATLTALASGRPLPPDAPAELDALGVQEVVWQAAAGGEDWTAVLGCPPSVQGDWLVWDRRQEACR